MPDTKSQGDAIREAQPSTTVKCKISAISATVVGEVKRATGLAEHGPVRAEPKVPLRHDRDPRVVPSPISAEPESDAVVDRIDEAVLRQHDRATRA